MPRIFYEIIAITALSLALVLLKSFSPAGPDAQLYYGLGQNLLSGAGYIDNIRHDEILPSVGYPALIALSLFLGLDNGVILGKLLLFASLLIVYFTCRSLRFNIPASLIFVFIFSWAIPPFDTWGVEAALVLSASFVCFFFVFFLHKPDVYRAFLLAFSIFIFILIRPLFLPLLLLSLIPGLFILFRYPAMRKNVIIIAVTISLLTGGVSWVSNHTLHDNRMLTGTYGGIPLYCAFNKYIPLTGTYYSGLWDKLPGNIRVEGFDPLLLKTTWQERDKTLKNAAISFIISDPGKAAEGYFWRLGRYSFLPASLPYLIIFYSWFSLSVFFISKLLFSRKITATEKTGGLILLLITAYIITLQSCFIYVGPRYYIVPAVFMFFSALYLISIIIQNRDNDLTILSDNKKKKILFLSALDFKEKSIQVIRKTPEAYISAGWAVDYVVARDNSKYGNYFYEKEINPEGVHIYRFMMPLTSLRDNAKNHLFRTILSKIAGYLTIFILVMKGAKILQSKKIDVVYGYEFHGVLALSILRFLGYLKNKKTVSRFQGTWLGLYLKTGNKSKLLLNFDAVTAMKVKTDLSIMTNDGTEGDFVMEKLAPDNLHNFKFWINGVDEQKLNPSEYIELNNKYKSHNEIILLSVCRLESWKRVDVSIKVFALVVKRYGIQNMKYIIIGEGGERTKLEQLARDKGVSDKVIFMGGIPHNEVKKYLNMSDIFISTYDLSNVGNPLLEAIRANKIIFTLSNGDTGRWIQHRENGFIYDPADPDLYDKMASGIAEITNDEALKNLIVKNIEETEQQKLWSWEERMAAEVNEVENLLNNR